MRVQLPKGDRLIELELDADTLVRALPLELRLELLVRLAPGRIMCLGTNGSGQPCRVQARPGGVLCTFHSIGRKQPAAPLEGRGQHRCTGKTRKGDPCRNPAVLGTDRCFNHSESERRCTAQRRGDWVTAALGGNMKGKRGACGAAAMKGADVCYLHSLSPAERQAWARRGQAARAGVELVETDAVPGGYGPETVKAAPARRKGRVATALTDEAEAAPPPLKDAELERLRRAVGLIK